MVRYSYSKQKFNALSDTLVTARYIKKIHVLSHPYLDWVAFFLEATADPLSELALSPSVAVLSLRHS